MTGEEFLRELCNPIAQGIDANAMLRKFTRNPKLIGDFAEASVRQLIARFVAPLRIARGAIIYEGIVGAQRDIPPELDCIIWQPCPVPAVFEAGDFALVPRISALAYLEIKSSNYSAAVGDAIEACLKKECDLVQPALHDQDGKRIEFAMGVVCIRYRKTPDKTLERLEECGKAVVLLEADDEDGTLERISDQCTQYPQSRNQP